MLTESPPIEIASLTGAELRARARERLTRGHGKANPIYREALTRGRFDPEGHGLSAAAAAAWRAGFALTLPELAGRTREETELGVTEKVVLKLADGLQCESVVLPMGHGRHTLCVSSQIGCKMGCRFCETGRMGLLRNMTAAEIVGQLLIARHVIGVSFRNVVFMGMGEALDNYRELVTALRVITDSEGMALGQERVTVCTVGRVDGIRALAAEGFKRLNLSISLNAGNDALRSELMPVNRKTPLSELQAALLEYRPRRNFALGVNYCLLPGINDEPRHAAQVANFCKPLGRVMVNLIPFNEGGAPLTRAPSEHEVERFVALLRDHGLAARRRITKGRDVMAACGQLGNVELRRKVRRSM